MAYIVHFDPVVPRRAVSIHAWEEMSGQVWDREGVAVGNGTFDFSLDIHSDDARQIQFKFRFPLEGDLWESDDFVRRLPDAPANEVWSYGFSARCTAKAPNAATLPAAIRVRARTHQDYRSGKLFLWNPAGTDTLEVPESARDDSSDMSEFQVPFAAWMSRGFHFKLKDKDGKFEPDRAIKVWRPSDGAEIYVKSRQFVVRTAPFELITQRINVIRPDGLGVQQLRLEDPAGDDSKVYQPVSTDSLDPLFACDIYQVSIYEECLYSAKGDSEDNSCWRVLVAPDGAAQIFTAIRGDRRWFPSQITRSVSAQIVLHPNQKSAFSGSMQLRARIGASEPYETVTASPQGGSWQAPLRVFPGVAISVDVLSPSGLQEAREDGNFSRLRTFSATADTVFHTVDGISGFSTAGPPLYQDVTTAQRRQLMAAAFSPAIVDSGVFDPWEMPHGATVTEGKTWFAVKAPHAVRSRLLVLQGESPDGERIVETYDMFLTPDLRYWWIALDGARDGTQYRFLLNDDQEVIDPACKLVNGTDRVWAKTGEGAAGPWSVVVDRAKIDAIFQGSGWRTMGWEALLIYEIHPMRFTRRNTNLPAFQQVQAELAAGGYLNALGVTALEFLPVNEYPKAGGWGYDPCAYFSVESSYGGPEEFARLVRKAHDTGRAVLLDVVYNHMGGECPLLAVGGDMYGDGMTEWGTMVDFDNPPAIEFFRQALLHLWQYYRLDGFRFDSTRTIVEGRCKTEGCVVTPGSGGGWEFLGKLHGALNQAASAVGMPWPYLVAENDPINDGLSNISRPHVMDGQWHFAHHYDLSSAACCSDDKSPGICCNMDYPHNQLRPYWEAVRYGESHDSTSEQESWKRRIVARTPYDQGYLMAKAVGAAGLLAKGIPMIFMGQEAGEHLPFYFGMDNLDDPSRYMRLAQYLTVQDNKTILAWFNSLMGFRNDPNGGFRGDDNQRVGRGTKTVAFTRGWDRYFVIATFGTPDTVQNLGWLGLPEGTYKEVLNSSWPVFSVKYEPLRTNGSYDARLRPGDTINLPSIGAVILERV